ncbi:MAG: hypothetical protein DSM107014_16640 [Gomphosphaeria aponina SAG 52.96 = DSM 107014]|uniref:TPR-like protein n=1 Tax=Gomphosphaeria aponina SAG 52.96 = DSM 107014 TaxID=1521640 RepID=A0A941JT38_9CHRO|nr:hypothetical protein [Gomphosphaeria aponina SAG 52.96 = DSM 107014]
MSEPIMERGNSFLKQNQFAEAGKLFRQLWEEGHNAYAASRYLYCLRKAGYPDAALIQGNKAHSEFTDNIYIQRELVWIHYEIVKRSAEQENLRQVIESASKLLDLQPESLPLELTILTVIKLAKQKHQWQTVSDWCNKIQPSQLNDDTPLINGRKVKSKREQWYFAYIKSLIELNSWSKVHGLALEAINAYPREINFKRWYALALAYQGDVEKAIAKLEDIILKERQEWYLFQDLSDLFFKTNQTESGFRYGCKAALASGEDKAKVTLYQRLAEIALSLKKWEIAARHIQLSKLIRQQEGWGIKANFEELESNIRQKCQDNNIGWVDYSFDELKKICRQDWRKESYGGLPRQQGVIESLPEQKSFGWIRLENGEKIFFMQKELPKFLRKENIPVNFVLEKNWNHKKAEFSTKAVDIQAE